MPRCVALLRGVNVGGHNPLPMSVLIQIANDLGFEEPKTLLQSGNLAFSVQGSSTQDLERALEREAAARLSFRPAVFVRTSSELEDLIANNPFRGEADSNPAWLHVIFLKSKPGEAEFRAVQQAVSGAEKIELYDRHLFVAYPNGSGASKVDRTHGWRQLFGNGTARNWNTVLRLATL